MIINFVLYVMCEVVSNIHITWLLAFLALFIGTAALGGCVGFLIICFVFSYLQFNEKGFLFNNAYIYASEQERETLDKKPYYKQSGIVFIMLGVIFVLNAMEMVFETDWLFYVVIAIAVIAIIYAIVSSIAIERSTKCVKAKYIK